MENEEENSHPSEGTLREVFSFPQKTDAELPENDLHQKKEKKKKFGSFNTMGLSMNVYKGILRRGYTIPTPIQRKTIPLVLDGHDVVAMARTGSGKTAAFLIPMLEKLGEHSELYGVRAIILEPTRELATQTMKFFRQLGKFTNLRACLLVGGESLEDQFSQLATNPDIIIGTPGRVVHHILEVGFTLKYTQYVVFDEADRLFEMGFAEQLKEIFRRLPEQHQNLLFSATLPLSLVEFARAGLTQPKLIRLDTETKISDNLKMHFFGCRLEDKPAVLLYLLKYTLNPDEQTIIFVSTRHHVEYLKELLGNFGFEVSAIYGAMDQAARNINIGKFRNGLTKLLIVTDVAARGIDIPLLDNVVNYDFPSKVKVFIHRVGRTARMGKSGSAFSLIPPDEVPYLLELYLFLEKEMPSADQPSTSNGMFTIGKIPQHYIDSENDMIVERIQQHTDLQSLYKVSLNAYKKYFKTRSKPSADAVKRSKDFPPISNVHPLIVASNHQEEERNDFVEAIKKFKPKQTVFEVLNNPESIPAIVMQNKRKEHDTKKKLKELIYENQDSLEEEDLESYRPLDNKKNRKTDFKDEEYFMDYFPPGYHSQKALNINQDDIQRDVVLDLDDDENQAIQKKQMVMKWDRKRKKYLFMNPAIDVNKKKKLKNESGDIIDEKQRGRKYKEWKGKFKAEIPKEGEKEDNSLTKRMQWSNENWKFKHKQGSEQQKLKDELKSKEQIIKQRKNKQKEENRLKRKKTLQQKKMQKGSRSKKK